MATVRTYRHPSGQAPANGTLVDLETVDLSGGTGAAHVDTTGWSPATYDITATRQDDGEAESDKSAASSLTVNAAGGSDNFDQGNAADPLTRTPPGLSYGDSSAAYVVGNGQVDGAGHAQSVADFATWGARLTTSISDTSQVVIKGNAAPVNSFGCVFVRSNGTDGYCAYLYGLSGTNYTNWRVTNVDPDGSNAGTGSSGAYSGSRTTDHTIKLVASGTSPVILRFYIDGVQQGSDITADTPIAGGAGRSPGFGGYGNASGGMAKNLFDDWQDS